MIDLTKQRFGRLIAIEPTDKRYRRHVVWRCLCDCGNECFIVSQRLQNKQTQSCGCLKKDLLTQRTTTHRMSKTLIYGIWLSMIQRCENFNNIDYKNYGGRGISVSEEFHDFQIWYEHIGPRLGPEYSQDRIENDGNYERGNIRWATQQEQCANSRPISFGPFKQYWFRAWHKDSMVQYLSNSQTRFAKKHTLHRSSISACLNGRQKTHRGWIFLKI